MTNKVSVLMEFAFLREETAYKSINRRFTSMISAMKKIKSDMTEKGTLGRRGLPSMGQSRGPP